MPSPLPLPRVYVFHSFRVLYAAAELLEFHKSEAPDGALSLHLREHLPVLACVFVVLTKHLGHVSDRGRQ